MEKYEKHTVTTRSSTFDDYFHYLFEADQKYSNVIVFIQIGSFYELYGSPSYSGSEERLQEISFKLRMRIAKKSKPTELKLSFLGFPTYAYEEHRHTLLKHGYTIIRYDQGEPTGNKKVPRGVGIIESPGTYIEATETTNYLLILYFKQKTNLRNRHMSIGISAIDLRTGNSRVYETHSRPNNFNFPLEEAYRYICSHRPVEIRVYSEHKANDPIRLNVSQYLELSEYNCVWSVVDQKMLDVNFQDKVLCKVYTKRGNLGVAEYIGLEKLHVACSAFVLLLDYVNQFHSGTLKLIHIPNQENSRNMTLANNAIKQLRVIPPPGETGMSSLFSVVDKTKTVMGKRLLKHRLINPTSKISTIKQRLDLLEELEPIRQEIDNHLKCIFDLETLYRRIVLGKLSPSDFADKLAPSLKSALHLVNLLNSERYPISQDIGIGPKKLRGIISKYKIVFNLDRMRSDQSFFIPGVHEEIDKCQLDIEKADVKFGKVKTKLENMIPGPKTGTKKECIKLDFSESDGYHLYTTQARSRILKADPDIKEKYTFKVLRSRVKITSNVLQKASDNKRKAVDKIKPLIMKAYDTFIRKWLKNNLSNLELLNQFISQIDVANSLGKVAEINNYVRPTIRKNAESFIYATRMRNPYIEQIITTEYIPNDVDVGRCTRGLLLYGPNMAGKSTYMRAVGLNCILAHIGSYVAAQEFEFSPYNRIITRIMGEDNERRGQSSFMVEMSELRIMLKCCDDKSLALGDEICRGTEHLSALSLVSATIKHLNKVKSSFVFTTHLHDLKHQDEIRSLDTVKFVHMGIHTVTDMGITFDRQLTDGPGPETYGIEIAKGLGLGEEFVSDAMQIRKKLEDISLVSLKQSKYNSLIHVTECVKCGSRKNLQVDHIKEQHMANEKGFVDHRHKNHPSNLQVLCENCHQEKTALNR